MTGSAINKVCWKKSSPGMGGNPVVLYHRSLLDDVTVERLRRHRFCALFSLVIPLTISLFCLVFISVLPMWLSHTYCEVLPQAPRCAGERDPYHEKKGPEIFWRLCNLESGSAAHGRLWMSVSWKTFMEEATGTFEPISSGEYWSGLEILHSSGEGRRRVGPALLRGTPMIEEGFTRVPGSTPPVHLGKTRGKIASSCHGFS